MAMQGMSLPLHVQQLYFKKIGLHFNLHYSTVRGVIKDHKSMTRPANSLSSYTLTLLTRDPNTNRSALYCLLRRVIVYTRFSIGERYG